MSNDPEDMTLEAQLRQLQRLLASARERLQAATARLQSDAPCPQDQGEGHLAPIQLDIERTRLICTSLLQDIQLLEHRLNGQTTNGDKLARGITPEMLQWARAQPINEEEIAAGLREIEETGGVELRDFIHELERAAGQDE
jgi:hypothetical protein